MLHYKSILAIATLCFSLEGFSQISGLQYDGNGCRQGTVDATIDADGDSLAVIYDEFFVEVDKQNRKDRSQCSVNLTIDVPAGKTLGFFGVDTRGYVYLEEKVKAHLRSDFNFNGRGYQKLLNKTLKGEIEKDFIVSEEITFGNRRSRWCSRGQGVTLSLQTDLKLKTRSGEPGYAVVDSTDGALSQDIGLSFLDCGKPSYVTQCRLTAKFKYRSKKSRKRIKRERKIVTHATAKTPARSSKKAERRARKKCQRLKDKLKGKVRCNISCGRPSQIP
tara:strand:+ start:1374 stop:2201 length:828 start_codon:yes stop_codon:yes gene_type:complete